MGLFRESQPKTVIGKSRCVNPMNSETVSLWQADDILRLERSEKHDLLLVRLSRMKRLIWNTTANKPLLEKTDKISKKAIQSHIFTWHPFIHSYSKTDSWYPGSS